MPTLNDVGQFLGSQMFGQTTVPMTAALEGKTIIVTGANTGLGYECAVHLAELGVSRLIIACRNMAKGKAARTKILEGTATKDVSGNQQNEVGNEQAEARRQCKVEVWEVDLSKYSSVLSFCDRVNSTLDRLDGFVANAGVEMRLFEVTEHLETTLTVNVVSTFLMATAILPKLEQTSVKYGGIPTHLCIVGSLIHTFGPDSQLEKIPASSSILDTLSHRDTAEMDSRYPLSKLMTHLCAHELAQRVSNRAAAAKAASTEADGSHTPVVVVNIVNPGWCGSELSRHKFPSLAQQAMFAMIGRTAEQGSRALVHGLIADRSTHNAYLSECRIHDESSYMQSERGKAMGRRLWKEMSMKFNTIAPGVAGIVS